MVVYGSFGRQLGAFLLLGLLFNDPETCFQRGHASEGGLLVTLLCLDVSGVGLAARLQVHLVDLVDVLRG